jgi:hypothetical protein
MSCSSGPGVCSFIYASTEVKVSIPTKVNRIGLIVGSKWVRVRLAADAIEPANRVIRMGPLYTSDGLPVDFTDNGRF